MGWLKALHLTFLFIWCGGLFCLSALLVTYAAAQSVRERHRLRIMTRFCLFAVASPAAALAIVTGGVLFYVGGAQGIWLPHTLISAGLLALLHLYCGRQVVRLKRLRHHGVSLSHLALAGLPVVLVSTVLWLVLATPSLSIALL